MATTTTRLGLRKPVDDDGLDVTSDIAGNMQLIDDQVALADDLLNLAGAGRTTETVKGANDTAVAAQTAINNHAARTDNPHNVTAAQIGALAASTLGQPNGPASLNAQGKLVQMPTAADVGAIPATDKGTNNGVATLGPTGKLVQMPTAADVGAIPSNQKGTANGVPSLDANGRVVQDSIGAAVKLFDSGIPGVAVVYLRNNAGTLEFSSDGATWTAAGLSAAKVRAIARRC